MNSKMIDSLYVVFLGVPELFFHEIMIKCHAQHYRWFEENRNWKGVVYCWKRIKFHERKVKALKSGCIASQLAKINHGQLN